MSSERLYDDFGNYIGPEQSDSESSSSLSEESEAADEPEIDVDKSYAVVQSNVPVQKAIATIERVENVEDLMIVEEEDSQLITEPVIKPEKVNTFDKVFEPKAGESGLPDLGYDFKYLAAMRGMPDYNRSVAIVGDLHHGKTVLCDMLMPLQDMGVGSDMERSSLRSSRETRHAREARFTDTRKDEQERGISIKATPLTVLAPDLLGRSHLLNVMDTPGHVNFLDEVAAAVRLADGAVLCVDALMGPLIGLKKALAILARENVHHLVLYLSCIDRLILELRLPPADAYFKLRYILGEINGLVAEAWQEVGNDADTPAIFDPAAGNVVFGSGRYHFTFTLESFAAHYAETSSRVRPNQDGDSLAYMANLLAVQCPPTPVMASNLEKLLWGDIWFDEDTHKFTKSKPVNPNTLEDEIDSTDRTFVDFILKPIYKIFSHVVGEEQPRLKPLLENELGIVLPDECYTLDTRSLLALVCQEYFSGVQPLVSAIVRHVPSPAANAKHKVRTCYSGNLATPFVDSMFRCDPDARCVVHVTKSYHRPGAEGTTEEAKLFGEFDVFGRVFAGTLRKGDKVKVLGERYSLTDDEDMCVKTVEHIWILEGRFRVEVEAAPAGSWVLLGGIDATIQRTATIVHLPSKGDDEVEVFKPLWFAARNVVKIACEPIVPAELPKMVEGLRRLAKAFPSIHTSVEDSGAHVLVCSGELQADCALHDLRNLYGDLEIRCADPVTTICETVSGESSLAAAVSTPNKLCNFTMTCAPLEELLAQDICRGLVHDRVPARELSEMLKDDYEWDTLASRSLWAFGVEQVPCVLVNDVLPSRLNTKRKDTLLVKDYVVHGFQWAVREGPLVEEEVRNVKFKLIDATIAPEPVHRTSGQIIPTARRAAYAGILSASPRLMEPMLIGEIICPADCVAAVIAVLGRRRGRVISDLPNPGTPLETILAYIPAIDTFGLETDIRTHTSGQAFIQTLFDRWEMLTGDPLDPSIKLRPLEPAPLTDLAREFLLKTRRRKGLAEDVNIRRFIDS